MAPRPDKPAPPRKKANPVKPAAPQTPADPELYIATTAIRTSVMTVRIDGDFARVVLPDCTCPDMAYRHTAPLTSLADDLAPSEEPYCKHLLLFYERLADTLAPGQGTFVMGSLTGRTRADGTPVSYELTLMRCSIDGVIHRHGDCPHALIAYQYGSHWLALPDAEEIAKTA